MIQIISNSNETSTGPELVQNGDFSQLGADVVDNGGFDELGTDVITNGSFTGVTELVTNGDFATDLSGWTGQAGRGTYAWDNDKAKITNNEPSSYPNLSQSISTVEGRVYKINATVEIGTATLIEVRAYSNGILGSQQLTSDGEVEFYAVANNGSFTLHLYLFETGNTGNYCFYDNVSVKEVGEDWTNGTGWTFGEDKAISTQALGGELVTNGDFSATGADLITNGDFSVGVDEIVDGDFPFPNTAWTLDTGVTVPSAGVLDFDGTSGAYAYQDILTSGNSYKVTIEVATASLTDTLNVFLGATNNIHGSVVAAPTTLVLYGVAGGVDDKFYVGSWEGTITSVSVEELGEDWTVVGTEDADHYVNFVSGGARLYFLTVSPIIQIKQIAITANTNYKFTCNTAYTGSGRLKVALSGTNYALSNEGLNTIYFKSGSGTEISFLRNSPSVDCLLSNVTLQELGEDWTVNAAGTDTVTFANDQVQIVSDGVSGATGILQSGVLTTGNSYKVTIDVASNSNKFKIILGGGSIEVTETGVQTFYGEAAGIDFYLYRISGQAVDTVINSIIVQEIATSYLTQGVSLSAKTWKLIYSVSDYIAGSVSATDYGTAITANEVGITEYVEIGAVSDFRMVNIDGYFEGAVTGISAELVDPNGYWTLGTGWSIGEDKAISTVTGSSSYLTQLVVEAGKSYKINYDVIDYTSGSVKATVSGAEGEARTGIGTYTDYLTATGTSFSIKNQSGLFIGAVTNISVQQLDPNGYWTLGTGWSIGDTKAISTVTGSNSDITQSILTAGKTYRTVFEVVDYTAGTVQAVVTGDEGTDRTAIETYTEDLTTTGTDFSIRSKLGTFDGSVSSVSAKLLGSYSDQSIYVTAADVQTIAQASVYYLVELTSMGSENSLYFIPSSVVANNGRYTKLNFTVVSKDALTQPTVGIISFYDSAGGFDTYPMGFYEFKIYEQTSSTNLDPLLATGLLEKGFAFVRDFSGNMQELTDGFNEYDPTLTQYVYSK